MPHAKSVCETMEEFLELHMTQLFSCGIPEHLWETLFLKLKLETFDAGESFMIQRVEVETDSEASEGNDNVDNVAMDAGPTDSTQPLATADAVDPAEADDPVQEEDVLECPTTWRVVVTLPGGIKATSSNHVYLVDHAWTYRQDLARVQLETVTGLLPRMAQLMDVCVSNRSSSDIIDDVLIAMWRYNQTYNIGNAPPGTDAAVPLWYIIDEFGSRIQHSESPNVRLVPFVYVPTQSAFSVLWPVTDIEENAEVTRDYIFGRTDDPLTRKLLLLPWQPEDMKHLSYELHEDDELFSKKFAVHETLPNTTVSFPGLPCDRNIRVYSDMEQVTRNLTDSRFEVVESEDQADIIWTRHYLKDFKSFSEETPGRFISQFPFEMVLTVKSLLPVVCRRGVSPVIDPQTLETFPSWLPITFSLETEISQFVSYFQHREARGLDNHWICKPFMLARGLDSCVTNNLACVLRLSESGPKIVSKYVEDPVLFNRDDVGPVKFDLRFVVMLSSVCPLLEAAVHNKFIVRVANKVFSLDCLDDYEKHFTVMNYRPGAHLKQIRCNQFIEMFNSQYADVCTWEKVQNDIYDVIRKTFVAASCCLPPKGIGHSPQSRAIYGFDVMLKWQTSPDGKKSMQPVLLEVNFGPDNTRLVREFPNFYNDLFSTLFFADNQERPVTNL